MINDKSHLASCLRSALGLLELDRNSQLYRNSVALCDYLEEPIFRIAVFGPFNYGKSTLLNAILGERTLPIDLIPTTGAAIYVRYGTELHTRITLTDGTEISEPGTDILKRFAILDERRRMNEDVASVRVYCPHSWLQTGVELLDLPGTNDREAQDALVRDKLLTADLIVQVLDARKLMTLGERENLRDWLLDRGIKTVIFVINFLNLLESEEQKQVYNRLLFVAESFRSELPNNISNLYRVDALPALRARLKGDVAAAQSAGLAIFESALQNLVAVQRENLTYKLPRIEIIAAQIQQELQNKRAAIASQIETAKQQKQQKLELQQKAQKLIKQAFQSSISDLQSWLYLPKLLELYQTELATALQQGTFSTWENNILKPAVLERQQAIEHWVNKASEFFDRQHPGKLLISFPPAPQISLPPPKTEKKSSDPDLTPVAIATGLGWILGGPVGAAVVGGATYFLDRNPQSDKADLSSSVDLQPAAKICTDAAQEYLSNFSTQACQRIDRYEKQAEPVMNLPVEPERSPLTTAHHQLNLLDNLLESLKFELTNFDRT
ncbi:MAG: dynamin family protein [Cyanosarcina radialis HA8281-LM2]|jgi:GTPase SAR1 family protein|nr:dynamin family protein [Cyanosarcina radialis HA8281-LM2]